MIYLLSQKTNTFGMLSYDKNNAINQDCLSKGHRLGDLRSLLRYTIDKRTFVRNMDAINIVWSSNGPTLVSDRFKNVVDRVSNGTVEFHPALVAGENFSSNDYWAINVLEKVSCIDMTISEYDQTNFDPVDPQYSFRYILLKSGSSSTSDIAVCSEQDAYMVVSEKFRQACVEAQLRGLIFYNALDLTYGNRTEAKFIL